MSNSACTQDLKLNKRTFSPMSSLTAIRNSKLKENKRGKGRFPKMTNNLEPYSRPI